MRARRARAMRWGPLAGALTLLGACTTPSLTAWRGDPPAREPVVERVAVPAPGDAALANLEALPVVRLRGGAYARGWAYGRATRERWAAAISAVEDAIWSEARRYVPWRGAVRWLGRELPKVVVERFTRADGPGAEPGLGDEERAYVQGIADGAGLPTERVLWGIAFVMLSDASCSAFAAFGPATDDGRLLQMRNLDWGEDEGWQPQRDTVLLVHEPPRGQRWLSIGFVGLVGSISGVNESGLSISEIGAGSVDTSWRGTPMPLMLDRVLERARTLDEAVAIVRGTPGTGGYNFVIGSARERRAAVIERTATRCAVFEVGVERYEDNPFFEALPGFDCRADTAADPAVRRLQDASRGPDGTPRGAGSYEQRYRRQLELVRGWGGRIDLDRAFELARATAPKSNLHSIVYDVERRRVYVRNRAWFADGGAPTDDASRLRLRAALQPAAVIDLDRMFPGPPR